VAHQEHRPPGRQFASLRQQRIHVEQVLVELIHVGPLAGRAAVAAQVHRHQAKTPQGGPFRDEAIAPRMFVDAMHQRDHRPWLRRHPAPAGKHHTIGGAQFEG
jgi:hypothetical protein